MLAPELSIGKKLQIFSRFHCNKKGIIWVLELTPMILLWNKK